MAGPAKPRKSTAAPKPRKSTATTLATSKAAIVVGHMPVTQTVLDHSRPVLEAGESKQDYHRRRAAWLEMNGEA